MSNPFLWPFRTQFAAGFLVCMTLLTYALYSQYQLHVDPCPLCILQRVAFIAMGLFFLIGALHGPTGLGRGIYALLVLLAGLIGMGLAMRHLWLQHLPKDQVPDCGPGLSYMLDAFPIGKTIKMIFTGSGECAEVNWRLLGLSMPGWTLISYVVLSVGALWAGFRRR